MNNIFITGASRGIGLEITRQCLLQGKHVIASCRNPEKANFLIQLKEEHQEKLQIMSLNVEDDASVASCFQKLQTINHSIDVLFNNAGVMDWKDFMEVASSSVEKIYKVNLVGCFLVTRAAIQCLQNSKTPLIVNLSSRLGSIELRGETQLGGAIGYQCSKAALNMLTKQTAIDLKSLKIRVISQSPGWVRTEMGGKAAKYEVQEAVSMMLNSLKNLPFHKTGIFIGEDGKEIPW